MKLSQLERYIYVLEASLKAYPDKVSYIDMSNVLKKLEAKKNKEGIERRYKNNQILVKIEDISWSNKKRYCCILIGCGDNTIPPHQYKNLTNGEVRSTKKKNNEAPAYAAHIVIDTKPAEEGLPSFTFLLERVPSLSISRIRSFLSAEIKKAFRAEIIEKKKKKSYTATLKLDGHASHTLKETLKTGILKNVTLVSNGVTQDAHDEEPFVEEKVAQIGMKIKTGIKSDQAVSFVQEQANKYKTLKNGNYDTMLVRVKTLQGPTKQTAVDLKQSKSVLEQAFYHQERILDFETPLTSSPTEIRKDVIIKMLSHMPKRKDD